MTRTTLHARCAIVEPIATMHGYRTMQVTGKNVALLKVLLRLTRDLFALFVQQYRPILTDTTDTERRACLSDSVGDS